MIISELEVKISAQMGEVTAQIAALKKQLEGVEPAAKKAEGGFSGMASMLKSAGIATAIYQIGKAAITASSQLEQNIVAMEVLTGSAEKAKNILVDLRKQAARTPFETGDLVDASKTLLNYGVSAESVTKTIDMLSNVAAGSPEKLQRISLAFGQISAAGRLSGADLLQLVSVGFNPLNEIAKKTGESMLELRKRMENGGVSAQEVTDAFRAATEAGGQFYQMNEKQAETLAGQWSTLKDNLTEILLLPIGDFFGSFFKDNIKIVNQAIDVTKSWFKENDAIGEQLQTIARQFSNNISLAGDQFKIIQKMFTVQKTPPPTVNLEKYKSDQKALASMMEGFEKERVKRSGSTLDQIELEYQTANEKLLEMDYISWEQRLKAKQALEKEFNARRLEDSRKSNQENAMLFMQQTAGVVGQAGAVLSQYYTNQNAALENQRIKRMEVIEQTYNADKAAIENSTLNQAQKNEQLKALDEKRARDEKKLNEKIDKEKRKLARESFIYQRAISFTQTLISTAQGVVAAWNTGPIMGMIFSPLVAALGAAQAALIMKQPPPALAQGGFFSGPALIGEAGREFAFPLDGPQGKNAMSEMASSLLDAMSQSIDRSATVSSSSKQVGSMSGNVYLDGALVGKFIQEGTRDGRILFDSRGMI